jgi:hypothetical protein
MARTLAAAEAPACRARRVTSAIPTTRRGCRRASSGVKAWTIEMVQALILNRAPIGPNFEDYSVLEEGVIVGRIFLSPAAPQDRPWMWASGHNGKIRRAAHGYEPTHEAAMAHSPKDGDRSKRLRFAILLSPWVAVVLALACPCASSFFWASWPPAACADIRADTLSAPPVARLSWSPSACARTSVAAPFETLVLRAS